MNRKTIYIILLLLGITHSSFCQGLDEEDYASPTLRQQMLINEHKALKDMSYNVQALQIGRYNTLYVNDEMSFFQSGNNTHVAQFGNSNSVFADINGKHISTSIIQSGAANDIKLQLEGAYISGGIVQAGKKNVVHGDISGTGKYYIISQENNNNILLLGDTPQKLIPGTTIEMKGNMILHIK